MRLPLCHFKMATTEVEDLAALVGIEIVPNIVNATDDITGETKCKQSHELSAPTSTPGETEKEDGDVVTEKASERLSALEEEFTDRYTQQDEEFTHTLDTPTHPPPCVTPWWCNDRGDRFRGRGGRGRDWNRGHHGRRDFNRDYRGGYQHQRGRGYYDNRHQGQGHHHDRRDRRDDYYSRDRRQYRDRSLDRRDRY